MVEIGAVIASIKNAQNSLDQAMALLDAGTGPPPFPTPTGTFGGYGNFIGDMPPDEKLLALGCIAGDYVVRRSDGFKAVIRLGHAAPLPSTPDHTIGDTGGTPQPTPADVYGIIYDHDPRQVPGERAKYKAIDKVWQKGSQYRVEPSTFGQNLAAGGWTLIGQVG